MLEIKVSEILPEAHSLKAPIFMEERTERCTGCIVMQVAAIQGQQKLEGNNGSLHGYCELQIQQSRATGKVIMKANDQFGNQKGIVKIEGDCQAFTPEETISDSLRES